MKFRSSLASFCLLISIVCVPARAWAQEDCEGVNDSIQKALGKLREATEKEHLEQVLNTFKQITSEACPHSADAWHYQSLLEKRLGRPAADVAYSRRKAEVGKSAALRDNLDPFQPGGSATASPAAAADNVKPTIRILSPQITTRGQHVKAAGVAITVMGIVTDASPLSEVTVNGRNVELDANNSFSALVTFTADVMQVIVTATDIHKNQADEKFTVQRDLQLTANSSTGASPVALPSLGSAGPFHALVIGNNGYKSLTKLQTAVKDAEVVGQILRDQYGFEVKLLLDANRESILNALNWYITHLPPNASLLIYYAGHGVFDAETKRGYWLPVDAEPKDDLNWVRSDDITTRLFKNPALHILVVADSCYSGTLMRDAGAVGVTPAERGRYLDKLMARRSRTLMASGGNEPVMDGGGKGHSIFAAALIAGLREMEDRFFTAEELFNRHVRLQVAGKADQTPLYSSIQNSNDDFGDFIFIRRK